MNSKSNITIMTERLLNYLRKKAIRNSKSDILAKFSIFLLLSLLSTSLIQINQYFALICMIFFWCITCMWYLTYMVKDKLAK